MEKTLAYYLTYLHKDFLSYTKTELKSVGLSYGQLPFILYIGKHRDCTQAGLTEHLHLDWGYCQRSVTKLTENGFINRSNKEGDIRNYRLSLTEKGEEAFRLSHYLFHSWDKNNLQGLSDEEVRVLLDLLEKIVVNNNVKYSRHFVE